MKYIYGIDIGGTTIKMGLFAEDGTLKEKWEIKTRTEDNGKNIISDIATAVNDHMKENDLTREDVIGIGAGVPGAVLEFARVNECVNLGWGSVDVAGELSKLTGCPVKATNDANAAALGEIWMGAAAKYNSAVMITLGTGVGGGIIIDGKIVDGSRGYGGEIGHMTVDPFDDRVCNCGKTGCLELYASATGIVYETKKALKKYEKSTTLKDITEVTSKDIITNGFYSLSVGTILLFLGSLAGFIAGIVSDMNDGKTIIASLGGAITLIILIIGSLYSMAKSFLKMYDFKARRGKNKLYIKYGLYNKVDFAIPIDKINAIVVHQTFIARIFRKYSAEIVNVGLNDDDKASAYFTFYCSKKQLKSYIDKLLPEFSEGIDGDIKKQPDKAKIKYIVDYLINSIIVLIVAASIIYYVNPSKVFEMAIVAGSAFILFYMFIAKILSFITCGVFVGDELVGVREGTMGTRYSLIKYCNIQYITINQNILEKKLRIAKGGLHILASMLRDDYLIPYMDENEISSIYNNIIK